jgi:hypothetical protein
MQCADHATPCVLLLPQADRAPRAENVEGSFFVDATCIDCDTCRMMAPATFSRIGQQSAVHQQPTDKAGRVAALQALFSCPTCVPVWAAVCPVCVCVGRGGGGGGGGTREARRTQKQKPPPIACWCVAARTTPHNHRFSIHVREKDAGEVRAAQQGMPRLVPGTSSVYANGWCVCRRSCAIPA